MTGRGEVGALGLDSAGDLFAPAGAAVIELTPAGNFDATATPAHLVATASVGAEAFLPDGQYLVSTGLNIGRHGSAVQLERFNSNGTQDPTFNSPAFHFAATPTDNASAIAVQPNGQVVIAGTSSNITTGGAAFGLARVNANGSLDASFGTGGVVTTSFQGPDYATEVALQTNGNIVVAGTSDDNSLQPSLALARYLGQ
ncbi:MAG: delta-60 repeat domain-containing protein [Jatrophihabitantaceae bacterium]